MKSRAVILTGFLLTTACLFMYTQQPPFMKKVAYGIYDIFQAKFSSPPNSGKIALIDIDESSLDRYGQWPWPRSYMAELTERLRRPATRPGTRASGAAA